MIGKNFESLEQRIIYSFIAVMPDYIPFECNEYSKKSQHQFCLFINKMLNEIYVMPDYIGLGKTKDEYYPDLSFNTIKPDLIKKMQKINKKLHDLFKKLINIGEYGTINKNLISVDRKNLSISTGMLNFLSKLGLTNENNKMKYTFSSDEYDDIFPA